VVTEVLPGADLISGFRLPTRRPSSANHIAMTWRSPTTGRTPPPGSSSASLRRQATIVSVEVGEGSWELESDTLVVRLPDLAMDREAVVGLTLIPREEGPMGFKALATTTAGDPEQANNFVEVIREVRTGADVA
jgi:hypothetical protein